MFTNKQILAIILPLLAEQFLTIFVGFADTIMVSSVGEAAISGVALVDQLTVLLTATLASFASGGAVLCAQTLGTKNIDGAKQYAKQLLFANLIVAVLFMLILILFNHSVLSLLFGGVDEDVMENAQRYLYVIAVSVPFFAIYNAFGAAFRAEGNTRVSLNVSILMNVINVVGNAVGIYVFKAGVYGVAVPTLLSRVAGAFVMYYAMIHSRGQLKLDLQRDNKLQYKMIKQIYALGIPMGMENFMFQLGRVMLTSLVATLGTASVAAYAAAARICNFAYLPGAAMSMAVPAIVGRCIGAGAFDLAKKNACRLLGYKYAIMLPVVIVISIFSPQIATWFHLSEAGIGFCVAMVLVNNAAMLIRPFAFQTADVLRSASDVRFPMVVSMISMWIFRIGCAYLFVYVFDTGVVGVYYGLVMDWTVRAVFYAWRFFSGKWIRVYQKKQEAVQTSRQS